MHKNALSYRLLVKSLLLIGLLLFSIVFVVWTPLRASAASLVGPKKHYLVLGDSLAFGFQPDLNFVDGYSNDFADNLAGHGVQTTANLACPGETTVTMLNGRCPFPLLRKFPYIGSQFNAALAYLAVNRGQVSPVTLDIGANDVLPDINTATCTTNMVKFNLDLANVDANLTQVILPRLRAAMTINGQMTGDIVMMNYYDPYQNICPNTVPLVQLINQHLAGDVSRFGIIIDTFNAFGGAATPNPNICSFTWMCSIFKDIHSTSLGYSVIASAFENGTGY